MLIDWLIAAFCSLIFWYNDLKTVHLTDVPSKQSGLWLLWHFLLIKLSQNKLLQDAAILLCFRRGPDCPVWVYFVIRNGSMYIILLIVYFPYEYIANKISCL